MTRTIRVFKNETEVPTIVRELSTSLIGRIPSVFTVGERPTQRTADYYYEFDASKGMVHSSLSTRGERGKKALPATISARETTIFLNRADEDRGYPRIVITNQVVGHALKEETIYAVDYLSVESP